MKKKNNNTLETGNDSETLFYLYGDQFVGSNLLRQRRKPGMEDLRNFFDLFGFVQICYKFIIIINNTIVYL